MSVIETSFIMTDKEYNSGIACEEYNGRYALVACNEGRDGKIYPRWCYPSKMEDGKSTPSARPLPWKIPIGKNIDDAMETLKTLALALTGGSSAGNPSSLVSSGADAHQPPPAGPGVDDIPF